MQKNEKMHVLNSACLAIFCSPGYSFPRWKIFTITHQVQSLQRSHIFIFFFVASEHIHDSSLLHSLQKRNIFITFPSFCCWKFLLFLIEGSLCQWPHWLYISYIDDNYFGDNNNSPVWYLSNMCLAVSSHLLHRWSFQTHAVSDKQKSAWSFYQVFKVHSGSPLPLLQCQRLKLGQVMWRRPQKMGPSYLIVVLTIFQEKANFNQRVSLNSSRGIRGFT